MITSLTVRDLTYILANLRAGDQRELRAHLGEVPPLDMAYATLATPWAFQIRLHDQPVAAFGAHAQSPTTVSAWAYGTDRFRRAVPQMTRFINGALARELVRQGFRWAEARSVEGHEEAHRWLLALGAQVACDLPGFGVNGERFLLFRRQLIV